LAEGQRKIVRAPPKLLWNKALEFEPNSDDVLVLIEALQSVPGRERELCATCGARAKLQLGRRQA